MEKEKLLVSACLVGINCKYNGKNNYTKEIEKLKDYYDFILICPESSSGMKAPRHPSERRGDKVVSELNEDVTSFFIKGAELSLKIAKQHNVKYALLKESSPSCGVHLIYDGTFSHTKISGIGTTAEVLKKEGIKLFSEEEISKLIELGEAKQSGNLHKKNS